MDKLMDKLILKNAIRLLIGGYLYDVETGDEQDELTRLIETPFLLREIADEYQEKTDSLKN